MIKVYNTLTNRKEEFVPVEKEQVKIYVCGLTVQDYAHIGHMRSAINYDVIRRYLKYKGYEVTYVQNFTDINEKIINKAAEEGLEPLELAEKYKRAYLEDLDNYNVKRADFYCTVTENIDNIIKFVQTLIDKNYAYEAEGNVYFSVEKFDDYGKLSGRNLEEMDAGSRVDIQKDKKHPLDFALWKKVDNEAPVSWDSPWGSGWPGWHIECSAMCTDCLGEKIDIHGGGTDLIFPHHENEIAQSEAYSGQKPFVKYWLHNGTVDLKGEKMSKSIGNFYTARELLEKFSAGEIRYFLLTTHYRNPIEFTFKEIENSSKSLKKLQDTKDRIKKVLSKDISEENNTEVISEFRQNLENKKAQFISAMDNDFNTAKAIGILNDLSSDINRFIYSDDFILNGQTKSVLKNAEELLKNIFDILGLTKKEKAEDKLKDKNLLKDLINYILEIRENARNEQNWELADKIRDDLQDMGIEVKDSPRGVEWNYKEEDK